MTRNAAISALLGAVHERWGIHSLTRGYSGARGSGLLAVRGSGVALPPALPPWWPGAEGYVRPTVLELSGPASCGKLGVALLWLAAASRGGLVAVVDPAGTFYPPAAAAGGLDLDQVVVVRPPDHRRSAVEAVSMLVTSAGFDAVLWPLEWASRPYSLDSVKLATLAARSNTTLLALVTDYRRAARAGDADQDVARLFPSADVRLRIMGWEWTWRDGELAGVRPRVRTERLRGAPAGQAWELRLERHALADFSGLVGADAASTKEDARAGALAAGGAAGLWSTADGGIGPATRFRPAGFQSRACPSTDHLCLAAALPLGGGGARATGPAGAADRGVRSEPAPASAARSA
jgi:hypothetical protein